MIRYTKIENALMLKDYVDMVEFSLKNPKTKFIDCLKSVLEKQGRNVDIENYYKDIVAVGLFNCLSANLSYYKDMFFDELKNDDIGTIEQFNLNKNIFVNPEDERRFSNKQIIKFIRNAVFHNDNPNHELCRMIKDGEEIKLEIELLRTRPPFHVMLDVNDYLKVAMQMLQGPTIQVYQIESKGKKTSENIVSEVLNNSIFRKYISPTSTLEDKFDLIINRITTFDKINNKYSNMQYRDFEFSIAQANTVEKFFNTCVKCVGLNAKNSARLSDKLNDIMFDTVPLATFKEKYVKLIIGYTKTYVTDPKNCSYKIWQDAEKSEKWGITNKYLEPFCDKDPLWVIANPNFIANLKAMYLNYVLGSVITEENIEINNKMYPREKLRDSFTHLRWFYGANSRIYLFDWEYGEENELNPNWQESFNLDTLIKSVHSKVEVLANNTEHIVEV